jgi:hypothetical protein
MSIIGIPTNVVTRALLDTPNNPPKLDEDGNFPSILTVRSGTAAALNALVLEANELAVETTSGVPRFLRVGDGATQGGKTPVKANVINVQFGGGFPAYPESVSDVTWTEITGTTAPIGGSNPRYHVNFHAMFQVPANTGMEFYWQPFSLMSFNMRVLNGGVTGFSYYTEGGMDSIYIPTTESGTVLIGGCGITLVGAVSNIAKFRCKAVPGGADKVICYSLYCEHRKIPVPVP